MTHTHVHIYQISRNIGKNSELDPDKTTKDSINGGKELLLHQLIQLEKMWFGDVESFRKKTMVIEIQEAGMLTNDTHINVYTYTHVRNIMQYAVCP